MKYVIFLCLFIGMLTAGKELKRTESFSELGADVQFTIEDIQAPRPSLLKWLINAFSGRYDADFTRYEATTAVEDVAPSCTELTYEGWKALCKFLGMSRKEN